MQDKLNDIRQAVRQRLDKASQSSHIEELRVSVLGRKGELTALLKGMGKLSPEERPVVGQKVNALRSEIEGWIDERSRELAAREEEERLKKETLDISIPGDPVPMGCEHPLSSTLERIIDIFVGMGFSVAEGPEVEQDKYNFELLNLPKNHPARDAQDTFYFNENLLLRTQTSPVQVAHHASPRSRPSASSAPAECTAQTKWTPPTARCSTRCEGLVVDKGITMADLKGTLDAFASRSMYGEGIRTRFRPSLLPVHRAVCRGRCDLRRLQGRRAAASARATGWIEILGAGMVQSQGAGDAAASTPDVYTGFAFGIGIERVTIRSSTTCHDMRLLFENDLRFLAQFWKREGVSDATYRLSVA